MKTVTSESTARPIEIDETSSPTTVYIRESIEESTRVDAMTGAENTIYRYTEKQFTRREWQELQMAKRIIDLECALIDAESGV